MRVLFTDSWNSMTIVQNVNSVYITDHIKTYDTQETLYLSNSTDAVITLYDPVESDYIYVVTSKEKATWTLKHLMTCDYADLTEYEHSTFLNPTAFEENLEKYFKTPTGEK